MVKSKLKFAVSLISLFGLWGCDYLGTFPKNIREFPEPWQVLEPGKPIENPPKVEIVTQGGVSIEPGDLVQIHILHQSPTQQNWDDRGEWWAWIGFLSQKETAFFSYEAEAVSSFVGLKQGTVFKFMEAKKGIGSGPQYAGKLHSNVFGDTGYYSWRKNATGFATLYTTVGSGVTAYEIKRVCKGQAKYRTVRLFDDSPVQICSGVKCSVSRGISEAWVEDARIDAVCRDGKKASFQYGPVVQKGHSPKHGYFDRWLLEAWDKLPVGVQLK